MLFCPFSIDIGDSGSSSGSRGTHLNAAGLYDSGESTDASAATCRGKLADNRQAQEEGEGKASIGCNDYAAQSLKMKRRMIVGVGVYAHD